MEVKRVEYDTAVYRNSKPQGRRRLRRAHEPPLHPDHCCIVSNIGCSSGSAAARRRERRCISDRDACQGTRRRSAACQCGIMMVRRLSTSGLGGAVAGSGKSERVYTEYNLKTASEGPGVTPPAMVYKAAELRLRNVSSGF